MGDAFAAIYCSSRFRSTSPTRRWSRETRRRNALPPGTREIERHVAAGMSPREAALHGGLRRMGRGMEQRKEECRDARGMKSAGTICGATCCFAVRQLRKSPRIHLHGDLHAGARHVRQRGHLCVRRCRATSSPCRTRTVAPRGGLRSRCRCSRNSAIQPLVPGLSRLEASEQELRIAVRLPGQRRHAQDHRRGTAAHRERA